MKRIAFIIACLMMVLWSAQSFAFDHSIGGFYRSRFIMADIQQGKDNNPDKFVDQRARVKWSMNVDEYITFVYYGEIDMEYGDAAYNNSRNTGGGASGDSVNLETKNLYIKAKLPETPLTATIGLQGYIDHNDFNLMLGDVAGVRLDWIGPVKGNVAWFKLSEGDDSPAPGQIGQRTNEDDATLWALQTMYSPSKKLSLNGDLYYADMKGSKPHPAPNIVFDTLRQKLYFATVGAKYKMDTMSISGWALYTGGTIENDPIAGKDVDVGGLAAAVKANFSVAGAKATVHGVFYSSDDDATDGDQSAVQIPWATNALVGMVVPFPTNGLMILMADQYGTTYHTGPGYGLADAGYQGYGMAALTAKVDYTPPGMPNLWTTFAAGYVTALTDEVKGRTTNKVTGGANMPKHKGTSIGAEVTARVGYKFGRFNVSLNGAYAMLGDFYDDTTTDKNGNAADPDNPYQVYAMVDVPF